MDLKDDYRIVPVHPQDHHLLAISWENRVYIDRALPFGLRSAPKLFTAVADALAWALHCQGIRFILHYLDDFLFLGTSEARSAANTVTETFNSLGVPVAAHKTEGPSTVLTFLGIWIDTASFQLHLPEEKLDRLHILLRSWQSKKSCTRKELESLLGHLSHAATVIRPGRIFLRRLFSLLSLANKPHHFIRHNLAARADLQWWTCFLQRWNGTSLFPRQTPSIHVYSDASGTFGCGAFDSQQGWFQLLWPPSWNSTEITAKELVPI